MSPADAGAPRRAVRTTVALVRASHLAPGAAVTLLTVALAISRDVASSTVVALGVAVFAGQLVTGWTNDLFDLERDRLVARSDKPLVIGAVRPRTVEVATAVAAVVCVIASLACGWAAGAVHLVLGVGAGLLYNLGVKATVFSPLPYLVAFGSLPVVVSLAGEPGRLPPVWTVVVAGVLGVGAHLLNVYPDLDDDAVAGVRGLPHRLGRRRIPVAAAVLLTGATVVCVAATGGSVVRWTALAVVVVVLIATVRAGGRRPFYGAILVAAIDAVLVVFA